MSLPRSITKRRDAAAIAILLPLLLALAGCRAPAPTESAAINSDPLPGSKDAMHYDDAWKQVEKYKDEQKYEAASDAVAEIRAEASKAGHEETWTNALIEEVQLRQGLHGYETAVRFLMDEPWPEEPLYRAMLDLYYAQSLVLYQQIYDYEIRQREQVVGVDDVDLKAWTSDQITGQSHAAYLRVWEQRERWGDRDLGTLERYIDPNDYPKHIRGTLRDALTYLWTDLLVNSSQWRPEQSNELFLLDVEAMILGDVDQEAASGLADQGIHPLRRACAILMDLQSWHLRRGEAEAAYESELKRLDILHAAFTEDDDRLAIRTRLESVQDTVDATLPWWSMGQWRLAEMIRTEDTPDHLIRARKAAAAGLERHPESIGGRRCKHLIAVLETPEFGVQAMASDACDKPSIQIDHKNMERLHFRAWRYDLAKRFLERRRNNPFLGHEDVLELMSDGAADLSWTVELPQTGDFRTHRTFCELPPCAKGAYAVVASARPDFRENDNNLVGLSMMNSDLMLVARDLGDAWEVCTRSASTGEPLSGTAIYIRRPHHSDPLPLSGPFTTNDEGLVNLSVDGNRRTFELLAIRGDDIALEPRLYDSRPREPETVMNRSFIYTDRRVYRPNQTIHWKAVLYKGGGDNAVFETMPEQAVTIRLRDANNEVVAEQELRTNAFGSASGSFHIPTGRLLGNWYLEHSHQDRAAVLVEEYKRPTFETTILAPSEPLRLNEPAVLQGEARYYFGLPVASGDVTWRVTREPVFPRWWWWRPRAAGVQTVASGRTTLAEDGGFKVEFTPLADAGNEDDRSVTYRYRLSADVTDEGGETRSAERSFRLGFVSVAAHLNLPSGFVLEGEPWRATVRRTDLNGTPRAGVGSWRVVALEQPRDVLLPADRPVEFGEDDDPFRTDGDRRRPRWDSNPSHVRTMTLWADGEQIAAGGTEHGEDGAGVVTLDDLAPGAYRLHYETEDDFGVACKERREFIIAGNEATPLALPLVMITEQASVSEGDTARLLVHTGLQNQAMMLEFFQDGRRIDRRHLRSGRDGELIEIPIMHHHRGGFVARLTAVKDHQLMTLQQSFAVPYKDRMLSVEFETFRDRLRPGDEETFRIKVSALDGGVDDDLTAAGAAELLATMYDRSLDVFAAYSPPSVLQIYPHRARAARISSGPQTAPVLLHAWNGSRSLPGFPHLGGDRLHGLDGYGIGGMGRRYGRVMESPMMMAEVKSASADMAVDGERLANYAIDSVEDAIAGQAGVVMREGELSVRGGRDGDIEMSIDDPSGGGEMDEPVTPRSNFSETAFFAPHLLLDAEGTATIEFKVPDSVTDWNVWVHALTRDLRSGSAVKQTASVKELMVRPYLPRFLREGDRADLKVVVNNAGERELSGVLDFELFDLETEEDLRADFGLTDAQTVGVPFTVEAGGGVDLTFPIATPVRVGSVVFRVTARAGDFSDGEQRPLPVLPGRMHLMQSRFVSLQDGDRREMRFDDLAADDDPTRIDEQLVVTVDAQLFYSVLSAMPYLVDYPYECSEQTLNRFLSTGILTSLFDDYPAVGAMAKKMSERDTRLEPWENEDPNRKLLLEETPWLQRAEGGRETGYDLIKVLDPNLAAAERDAALTKLRKMQSSDGGFPWWPGGRPSPYLTLYILHGFSKGLEFGVEIPPDMVVSAWGFMKQHYLRELVDEMLENKRGWQTITFLNYVLSCYPDGERNWTGGMFDAEDRADMLAFSFDHWKEHAPYLKGYLALTLARADRRDDAMLVFDSIMDSARTDRDLGTYWAPEDRAWLWYNDTIETHAFALRVMTELTPDDERRDGLVQWLLLNKKLNHWSSTRATSEVVYALTHYLQSVGGLGVRETAKVSVGSLEKEFVFEPDEYTGARNRLIIPGDEIDPSAMATVVVEKTGRGTAFASATWHFSTERMPESADGDLFGVTRNWFKRVHDGRQWTLEPLTPGDAVAVGDQLEVQLDVRAKHAAEFVHLRDPRGAGFEPESTRSGYRWDRGVGYYEEVRDSGANFFFDWLPAGQVTMRYRLRATTAGTFKVAPAVMQSMYAPEFAAHSAGGVATIE